MPEMPERQLQAHVAEILEKHSAIEDDRHFEELIRLCRANALKYEAHGQQDEAQKWRNYANRLGEAAAIKSELVDKLRAHLGNGNGHWG